ncbi:NADPH:quinone reductase [Globomyces pollinis-pini]|nr:NADPH:quinone reductase [Globomyces pollinis-pini]
MKAIKWTAYGGPEVLKLANVTKPVPTDNQVLIKIMATSVSCGDTEMRGLNLPSLLIYPIRMMLGITKPKTITILGQEFSGIIEKIGKDVKRFKIGDEVMGTCGMKFGSYAQFLTLPESNKTGTDGILIHKPTNIDFVTAASVPIGALEGLEYMKKAQIKKDDKALIIGGGGSIGHYAIQIAKHFGAHVTAVDAESKLEMMTSIGADKVIDFRKESFKSPNHYDIIFDVLCKSDYQDCVQSLKPSGRFLMGNLIPSSLLKSFWLGKDKKVIHGTAKHDVNELLYVKELIEQNVIKPVVRNVFDWENVVEAHAFAESGMKQGGIVLRVNHTD